MTTTFTKSQIFTAAWELARAYAKAEGTGSKAQFARALRDTYASVRQVEAEARAEAGRAYVNALRDDRAGVVSALSMEPTDGELLARLTALDAQIAFETRA